MIKLDEILSKFEVGKNSTMTHGDCKILMREAIRKALDKLGSEIDKDLFNEMQIKHINETIEKLKSRLL